MEKPFTNPEWDEWEFSCFSCFSRSHAAAKHDVTVSVAAPAPGSWAAKVLGRQKLKRVMSS